MKITAHGEDVLYDTVNNGLEDIYENVERRDIEDTTGPQTQKKSRGQEKEKDLKRSKKTYLVMLIVSLWGNEKHHIQFQICIRM